MFFLNNFYSFYIYNQTSLHYAVMYQYIDLVDFLLENNAPLFHYSWECTPLHIAAENGNTEIITKLVKKGASLTDYNKNGNTPLIVACMNNRIEAAKLLLKYGSHPNETGEFIFFYITCKISKRDDTSSFCLSIRPH